MRWLSRLGVALLFAAGCGRDLLSPDEERALASAEAKWEAAALDSYTFEYRLICFCDPAFLEWMRITVQDGVLVDVVYADSTDVTPPVLEEWPTVAELFGRIHQLRDGASPNARDVDLEFDATLGYPTLISISLDRDLADGGATHLTRNLVPTF